MHLCDLGGLCCRVYGCLVGVDSSLCAEGFVCVFFGLRYFCLLIAIWLLWFFGFVTLCFTFLV